MSDTNENTTEEIPAASDGPVHDDLAAIMAILDRALRATEGGDAAAALFDDVIDAAVRLNVLNQVEFVRFKRGLKKAGAPLKEFNDLCRAKEVALRRELETVALGADDRRVGRYYTRDGRTWREHEDPRAADVLVANFTARISEELQVDDGVETRRLFRVTARFRDGSTAAHDVSASELQSARWVTPAFGSRAVVMPGNGSHFSAALQLLSPDRELKTAHGHTGWVRVGDDYGYLTGAGALGSEGFLPGVDVLLEPPLDDCHLEIAATAEELKDCVKASLALLDVADRKITVPVFAATYRAPLNEALPSTGSLFLSGPSGSQKTEVAAQAQAHYGAAFEATNLPTNFISTDNANEIIHHRGKDALIVHDDYVTVGSAYEDNRLNRSADRAIRGAANRAGRIRMTGDGRIKRGEEPRCLLVATGEDTPRGSSMLARMLVVEFTKGCVDLDRLTQLQRDAASGKLAKAMGGYIQFLAARYVDLQHTLPERFRELREAARSQEVHPHDRTPDTVAHLQLGIEHFVAFALSAKALSKKAADKLTTESWQALTDAAVAQSGHQQNETPVERFLSLIATALTTGKAHVCSFDNKPPEKDAEFGQKLEETALQLPAQFGWSRRKDEWVPRGRLIGWVDGGNLYLQQHAAYAVVQQLAREEGQGFPLKASTIYRQLRDRGLAISDEPTRTTTRISLSDARRIRVVQVPLVNLPVELVEPDTVVPEEDWIANVDLSDHDVAEAGADAEPAVSP